MQEGKADQERYVLINAGEKLQKAGNLSEAKAVFYGPLKEEHYDVKTDSLNIIILKV